MRPDSAPESSPVVLERVQAFAPNWPIKIADYNLPYITGLYQDQFDISWAQGSMCMCTKST